MTKYTNPFFTLHEAQAILKSMGANTRANDEWLENILTIWVDKVYETHEHGEAYFRINIQLNIKGFNEVSRLIGKENVVPVRTRPFLDVGFEHSIEPSPLLRLFALEDKQ